MEKGKKKNERLEAQSCRTILLEDKDTVQLWYCVTVASSRWMYLDWWSLLASNDWMQLWHSTTILLASNDWMQLWHSTAVTPHVSPLLNYIDVLRALYLFLVWCSISSTLMDN